MDNHGGNVFGDEKIKYDFSVNLSPLGLPRGVRHELKALTSEEQMLARLEIYTDEEQRALRKALGEYYGVNPQGILCGNGAADLIYRIPKAIYQKVKEGAKANPKSFIQGPAFSEYEKALKEAGFDVEYVLAKEEEGFIPGASFVEKVRESDAKILFLCNPANPTGVLMDKEYVLKVTDLCEEKEIYLVVDECFLELTDLGESASVISETSAHPHLIVLRSFTKTYAMAGLRLGYAIAGDENLAEELRKIGQPWSLSFPAEVAGLAALKEKEYLSEVRVFLSEERVRVGDALETLGLKVIKPSANYIFFFGPIGLDEKLRKKGFLIRNCRNYKGLSEGAFRIAIKGCEENDMLLEAIRDELR